MSGGASSTHNEIHWLRGWQEIYQYFVFTKEKKLKVKRRRSYGCFYANFFLAEHFGGARLWLEQFWLSLRSFYVTCTTTKVTSNGMYGILNGWSTWRSHKFPTFRAHQPWVENTLESSNFDTKFRLGISLDVLNFVFHFTAQPGGDIALLYSKPTSKINETGKIWL